jgi:hypothetical protein
MTFAEMIAFNRERLGLSHQDFAEKCGIPVELLSYIDDPARAEERLIVQCANALGIKVTIFTGEEKPEPTYEELLESTLNAARYPGIRKFLIDSSQCSEPKKIFALFGEEKVSIAERNLILHFSTNALYHFCNTSSSLFKFDEYLFKLHSPLFTKYEQEMRKSELPEEEKNDRIDTARKNVFACDSMENIAIRIAEPFADELEAKLRSSKEDYGDELELPLRWDFNEELMKIRILGADGACRSEIKLLTVREQEKSNSNQTTQ